MVAGLLNAASKAGQYGPRMAGWLQGAANVAKQAYTNPWIRTGLGAGIGYTTADPGERLQGALRGGAATGVMGPGVYSGAAGFVGNKMAMIPGLAPTVAQNLATVGVPLAGMRLLAGQGSGAPNPTVAQGIYQTGGGVRDIAAGQILYNAQGEPVSVYGPSVPGGYGGFGPPGNVPYGHNIWDVASPTGGISANLLMSNRQAQTMADNINVLAPTQMKYAEERARRELDRQLTAAQVRKNIELAAQMTANQQVNALNMGRDTMQAVARAINANPRYY